MPQILAGMEDLGPAHLTDLLWSIASMEVGKEGGDKGGVNFRPPPSWMQLLMQVGVHPHTCLPSDCVILSSPKHER